MSESSNKLKIKKRNSTESQPLLFGLLSRVKRTISGLLKSTGGGSQLSL